MENFEINYYGNRAQCNRPTMQDFYGMGETLNKSKFFIVCDGHGYSEVPAFFVLDSYSKFLKELNDDELSIDDIKKELNNYCFHLDKSLKNFMNEGKKIEQSGTTFVMILITKKGIFTVNIGDSVFLFNTNKGRPIKNILHVPSNNIEKERILKNGGRIVWPNRINGIINVSRTFGDFEFKKNNLIIVDPDINFISLDVVADKNNWCLLASDGIYLRFNDKEIQYLINRLLLFGQSEKEIVDTFINYSKKKGMRDNVTMILVLLTRPNRDLIKEEIFKRSKTILKEEYEKFISPDNEFSNESDNYNSDEENNDIKTPWRNNKYNTSFSRFLVMNNFKCIEEKDKILYELLQYEL